MTQHALKRIAERLPGSKPSAVLHEIKKAVNGRRREIHHCLGGEVICEVLLSSGQTVFPIVALDGNIKTVLTEHMDVTTTIGRVTLIASDRPDEAPLGEGLHDIPGPVYHADPAPYPSLSSSIARLIIKQSARHAWTASAQLNPDWEPTESKVFDIGRAAHRAVLGKGGDYIAYPDAVLASNGALTTKAAKEFTEWARAKGLTPLKAEDVERIEAMAAAAQLRLDDMGIKLDPARSELTAIGRVDDVWCRAMVDNAPEKPMQMPDGARLMLIDFKTTEDASPDACRRSVESYGYDLQMAHYRDTWKAATGEDRDFLFIFQEKNPPYEIGVVRLLAEAGHSADWLEDAREKARYARTVWRECLKTGIWPGYPPLIMEIGAASFYRQKWQDTAARAVASRSVSRGALERAAQWQSPSRLAGE